MIIYEWECFKYIVVRLLYVFKDIYLIYVFLFLLELWVFSDVKGVWLLGLLRKYILDVYLFMFWVWVSFYV